MSNIRNHFPIFKTNLDLIYLDSTATSQKPSHVIDGVKEYLESSYANIHRWSYDISAESQKLYEASKQIVADHIGAENWREVVYTGNSTYALNLLAQSIWRTGLLKKGDKVLVSIVEHHANIVPWLILKEDYGIEVEYINVKDDYSLDYEDFRSKLDDNVKIVSLTHVSNVTGQIFDLERVNEILDETYASSWGETEGSSDTFLDSSPKGSEWHKKPLFIVDASQSVPHFRIDVKSIGCDALFFTGHKVFADSGIGVLWGKEDLLKSLKPIFSGGGAIGHVEEWIFTHSAQLPDRFEPGTPNLSGAVSLLRSFEYIESIWGYEKLESIERELVEYTLRKFEDFQSPQGVDHNKSPLNKGGDETQWSGGIIRLIWGIDPATRVGVFTFYIEWIHSFDISDYMADRQVCIRAGQHCAEPLMIREWQKHTCRMSLHIYNTKADIDRFFEVLREAINELK